MKNMIIKFIKKHRSLYNLAKKVNRKLNRIQGTTSINCNYILYAYVMKDKKDLDLIKKHYMNIKRYNTKLFILIDNYECSKKIHQYIRENIGILFASVDFFRTYHKQFRADKIVFLSYKNSDNEEILSYIK